MSTNTPQSIIIIAGKGAYPGLLASSARIQGVQNIVAVAFRRETDPSIEQQVDQVHWIHLGQLQSMLDAIKSSSISHAVMAGQITPTHLFNIRLDAAMMALLKELPTRNAETIFGAIADQLHNIGVELLPASSFMQEHMPAPGILTSTPPSPMVLNDIAIGYKVACQMSHLDVGQTTVIKEGTILAVEAFEGTDQAIKRAGQLGGPGVVVVKVAKDEHDMRFDIPVIGLHTIKVLKNVKAAAIAVVAGRSILLEKEEIINRADNMGLSIIAIDPSTPPVIQPTGD